MLRIMFTMLFMVGTFHAYSQDSLRILSWNIQMLPTLVNGNGKAKRARVIVDQLQKQTYDVVVFQEMFKHRSRKIITKGLSAQFPHHTSVLNKKALSPKTNGGVMIFSRHPIKEVHEIQYTHRSGFDKLSRKGAVLAELDIRGKRIQVIGTHLQAFGTHNILYSQYHQLHDELLKPHEKDGVLQLVCGDFNTLKTLPPTLPSDLSADFIDRLPRYQYMLEALHAHDGDLRGYQQFTMDRPYNDLCKKRKEFRLLLDYILVRKSVDSSFNISRQIKVIRYPWHKKHQDLSDHFGVEAVVSGY